MNISLKLFYLPNIFKQHLLTFIYLQNFCNFQSLLYVYELKRYFFFFRKHSIHLVGVFFNYSLVISHFVRCINVYRMSNIVRYRDLYTYVFTYEDFYPLFFILFSIFIYSIDVAPTYILTFVFVLFFKITK